MLYASLAHNEMVFNALQCPPDIQGSIKCITFW